MGGHAGRKSVSFRAIFILLNAVLLVAFGFIISLPLLLLGRQYTVVLEASGGAARLLPIVLFALALLALNGYFVRRWRLFRLLDDRDWPAAADYLQHRVLQQARPGGLSVRLLANTLLLSGRVPEIAPLERHVAQRRLWLYRRMLLHLVIPYLVGDANDGVGFFAKKLAEEPHRPPVRAWLLWDYAFCLIRAGQPAAATEPLRELATVVAAAGGRRQPATSHVVALLGAYAAARLLPQPASLAVGVEPGQLAAAMRGVDGDPHVVVFATVIAEARRWLDGERGALVGE